MSADKQIREILKRLKRLEKAATFGMQDADVGRKKLRQVTSGKPSKIDFGLNERNFVKTYAKGMSGPKKFTLLLAFIAKGKVGEEVKVSLIRSKWNKLKAKNLLGYKFNVNYPNAAKTSGWVDTKKYGTYFLRNSWMQIF
jgi:hypothetical protein